MARLRIQKLNEVPWMIGVWRKKPLRIIAMRVEDYVKVEIDTPDGLVIAKRGDYILQEGTGELRVIRKATFEKLYEKDVEEET